MADVIKWKYTDLCDLTGYTLVVSSVAVGNVGQLACDLLISSLNMRKLALLYSPALIPVAGNDPYKYGSKSIAGACELYLCETKKLIVLLLRAPLVHKYAEQFLSEVVDKAKADNLKDIIILTSSFAHEKKHVMTSPFRYLANEWCSFKNKLKELDWVEHECDDDRITILGGGFASLLYRTTKEKSVPCLLVYKFVSEGDNVPDATEMVQHLNAVVPMFDEHNFSSQLIYPFSWNLMFGGPPPQNIY